jgi:hypothetical protein
LNFQAKSLSLTSHRLNCATQEIRIAQEKWEHAQGKRHVGVEMTLYCCISAKEPTVASTKVQKYPFHVLIQKLTLLSFLINFSLRASAGLEIIVLLAGVGDERSGVGAWHIELRASLRNNSRASSPAGDTRHSLALCIYIHFVEQQIQ